MELTEKLLPFLSTEKVQEEFYDRSFEAAGSFGVRVSRGGRRSFFLVCKVANNRRRYTLGDYPNISLLEAREKACRIVQQGGLSPLPETFEELAAYFLGHFENASLAKKTRKEYERILEKELIPHWRYRRLAHLPQGELVALIEKISQVRSSPVMAERTLALLRRLYRFAEEKAILTPSASFDFAKFQIASPEKELRSLEWAEIEALWFASSFEPPGVRNAFRLLLLTGQRLSDITNMRWSEIELEEWRIDSSAESPRLVPLHPQAQAYLREMKEHRKSEFVFTQRSGKPIVQLRRGIARIGSRASISPPPTSVELRRFVEQGLRGLRVRPDVCDKVLGRRVLVRRSRQTSSVYDYREENRAALMAWGKKLMEHVGEKGKKRDSNIVSLFSED